MVYHILCNTCYRAIQQQNHWESAAANPPSIYQTNNGNILLHEAQVGCPTNWLFYELMEWNTYCDITYLGLSVLRAMLLQLLVRAFALHMQ